MPVNLAEIASPDDFVMPWGVHARKTLREIALGGGRRYLRRAIECPLHDEETRAAIRSYFHENSDADTTIEPLIERWHDGEGRGMTITQWLGWTWDRYVSWVSHRPFRPHGAIPEPREPLRPSAENRVGTRLEALLALDEAVERCLAAGASGNDVINAAATAALAVRARTGQTYCERRKALAIAPAGTASPAATQTLQGDER